MQTEELLRDAQEVIRKLEQQTVRPGGHDFLLQACAKDEQMGFGSRMYTKLELDKKFGVGRWLPLPRFEIIQPNGKHRPIDDGSRNHHNAATGYSETLDCVTALQPAVHIGHLVKVAKSLAAGDSLAQLEVETGSEDMPDAYRWVPNSPDEAHVNVVAVFDEQLGEWRYEII